MKKLFLSVEELVGNTPLMRLSRIEKRLGLKARVLAKLEYFNPAGSVKDRVALAMIERAEKDGALKSGSAIIEPTSGNTGIALAAIARARGYRVIIVMPDNMSEERRKLVKAYGAELVLTDGAQGMAGAIKRANELVSEIEGGILAGQFTNSANPQAHYDTTGREIFEQCGGEIDALVAGVGTGGTVSGAGTYLKERNPEMKIIAVEPSRSAVLSGEPAGRHGLQGIGAGFIPETLNTRIYDEIITVTEEQAYKAARLVASCEGVLVGISSGAAAYAAFKVAEREKFAGKTVAVIFPDGGERYLSTQLFN
ncbi:MAG: cysteine synthase A [Clostridia bacterium]|nr:cysteine synthase A [Clostridia bacterium]